MITEAEVLNQFNRIDVMRKLGAKVDILSWIFNNREYISTISTSRQAVDKVTELLEEHTFGFNSNMCFSKEGCLFNCAIATLEFRGVIDFRHIDKDELKLYSSLSDVLTIELDGFNIEDEYDFRKALDYFSFIKASYGLITISKFRCDINYDNADYPIGNTVYTFSRPVFCDVQRVSVLKLDNLQCGCVTTDDIPVIAFGSEVTRNVLVSELIIGFDKYKGRNVVLLPFKFSIMAHADFRYNSDLKGFQYITRFYFDGLVEVTQRRNHDRVCEYECCYDSSVGLGDVVVPKFLFNQNGNHYNPVIANDNVVDENRLRNTTMVFKSIDLYGEFIADYALKFMLSVAVEEIYCLDSSCDAKYIKLIAPKIVIQGTNTPEVWESVISTMKFLDGKLLKQGK